MLTDDEQVLFDRLLVKIGESERADALSNSYYDGEQQLQTLGLAVPPELERFTTIVAWPAMVVDTVAERIRLKGFVLPGQADVDEALMTGWDGNNLDSEQGMLWNDVLVYGRGYVSIGASDEPGGLPVILVESPTDMAVRVDARSRRVVAALKAYRDTTESMERDRATLYTPDRTTWLELERGRWVDVDVDDHRLGRVPVVPLLNRRRSGRWVGVSEMKRAISLTDAAARALTNLQVAQETHALPQRWALGFSKGDFADRDGNLLPVWRAYFTEIWASSNADGKVGQFTASDLRNFTETVNFYGSKIAGIYGLPPQYVGVTSSNPASAEAIKEAKEGLVLRAEHHMLNNGDALGKVMAIYSRFATGQWPDGNRIRAIWHDPSTPTLAALADAVQKLNGGRPILSREGSWDLLDWSEARKAKERSYWADEESDPMLGRLADALDANSVTGGRLKDKADAMGTMIRAGVQPEVAARLSGLPEAQFTGAVPVSLRPPGEG